MAEETVIIDIQVEQTGALKAYQDTKKATEELRNENVKLISEIKLLDKTDTDYTNKIKAKNDAIALNDARIKNNTLEMNAQMRVLQNTTKNTSEATGAYAILNQRYREAAQGAKDLAAIYGVADKRTIEATTSAKKLSDQLKRIDESVGQNQRNVGNYSSVLAGLPGSMGAATQGVMGLTAGFKALSATPLLGTLQIAVVVFMALKNAIGGGTESANKLAQSVAPLTVLFEGLLKVVTNSVGIIVSAASGMVKFLGSILDVIPAIHRMNVASEESIRLEKEKQALKEENRLDMISDAKDELDIADLKIKVMRKDLYTAKERLAFAKEADAIYERNAREDVGRAERAYQEKVDWYALTNKDLKALDDNQKEELAQLEAAKYNILKNYKQSTLRLNSNTAKLNLEIEAEAKKVQDEARSAREKADSEAQARREKRQSDEIKSLNTKLSISKVRQTELDEMKLMDTKYYQGRIEDARKFADDSFAIVEKEKQYNIITQEEAALKKYEIEKEYNNQVADLAAKRVELFADALKKDLEAKKKSADDLKTEDERIHNANLTNAANRLDALNEYSEKYLRLQKLYLEEQMQVEIDAAEESGAQEYLIREKYAKLQEDLDKQKRDARIQALSDMFGNIAGLFGENTKVAKMAASAQIAVDTYKGATAAFTSMQSMPLGLGIPLGIAAAAVVTASGLANIQKVWQTKSGLPGDSGGGGTSVSASIPQSVSQSSATQAGTVQMSSSTKVATQSSGQDITSQVAAGVSQALKQNPIQPTLVIPDLTKAMNNMTVLKSDNSL